MLKTEQTRFPLGIRRASSPCVDRLATLSFIKLFAKKIVAVILIGALVLSFSPSEKTAAQEAYRSSSPLGAEVSFPDAPVKRSASPEPSSRSIVGETTKNARCVQRTFRVPEDQNAALIGAFILRLLPEKLREQTTCRYSETENIIIMYGPEQAIVLSENLLNNFSETLFEAFLTSGEFVSVAGVSRERPIPSVTTSSSTSVGRNYYDPNRNDFVKVAYDPQGAILPERQEYAVAFGAGARDSSSNDSRRDSLENNRDFNRPTLESALRDNATNQRNDEDSMLDVVVYRCSPSICERVAQLVERRFAGNPEVAFSVDSQIGTIVVHTNRKLQREARDFLASLQVYPARNSAYGSDLRVIRGDVVPVDGGESAPNDLTVPQYLGGLKTGDDSNKQALNMTSALSDVYVPQTRKAEELQDSLLQLFGERLVRMPNDETAPFVQRQKTVYRFVKRQSEDEKTAEFPPRTCDVVIDALHNAISLQGDPQLCSEMLALLRAMDQPPLRNGNVRRFIPIRNCDPNKLRQIFEYDAKKASSSEKAWNSSQTIYRIAEELRGSSLSKTSNLASYSSPWIPLVFNVERTIDPEIRKIVEFAGNKSLFADPFLDGYVNLESVLVSKTRSTSSIRQVNYQDGDLSALDATTGNGDFDSFRNGRDGFGVVQDFTPTVLQDLDVVIVDNATDAEFERIKQMIEQIEELAKIADVQTEIYNLKYVDCAMLHGVLSTLYAEMFTTKQGRVVFYALQNPNALLIAGWGQAFNDMKSLVELFDKPVAAGTGTYRVVRLKYASVDEIADLLSSTFLTPQTTGTGGFAPRIRVFADVRTNSLVIQAAPNDWNEIRKLLLELDVNKAETTLVTRVFPLKNSLAENIRTTIMNAILPAKQGTLDTTAAKFPVLQLLSVDETGRRLVESGVMMDVDVTADVFHNQLIVNAPEDCMDFMERLIELLDVAPKKAQIRFFQVRHGDASQIVQTLQSLLATSDDNLSTPTLPQAEAEESFVPVRFALDNRTNVIIAAAAPKELAIVDALIVALDVKDTSQREEVVVQLRNIQALVVAEAIDSYLTQKQTLETASEVLSNYQLYESQVIVIPESISNSIIVSASPEEMPKILEMIRTFDQDPPQVQIKVLIAEVTLTDQEEFGIESGLQNSTSFDRSTITSTSTGSSTGVPGFDIVGSNGPGKNMSANVDPTDIAGQVLNNFAMGTTDSSLGYGGFVLSASSRSIAATLRALREKNRLQVLSCPQVTAMDNQQAFILVGQRVPRINGTTTTNYGVQMNTTDTPVGLILLVTPRVTKDGKVVMEIGAEKSSLGNDSDATPIYSQDGEVIKSRSIDTIQTMTAISARDGETVMLGGLLTSQKEKVSRGVPYVSDIPVLGWLFRYDQESTRRTELLIVMTPRIMRNSEDFAEVMQREVGRMNLDLDEAMSINGNMGLYDPCANQGYQPKQRRFIRDIVSPDKMDELEKIPPYSPSRDYKPRPENEILPDNSSPTTATPTTGAVNDRNSSGIGNSVVKRRFSSRSNASIENNAGSGSNASSADEEFLLDDHFSADAQNGTLQRGESKVAMRAGEKIAATSLTQREQSNQRLETLASREIDSFKLQSANDLRTSKNRLSVSLNENAGKKALGISQYRKTSNKDSETPGEQDKRSIPASSELEEAAGAYEPDNGTIRGQIASVEATYQSSLDPESKISGKLGLLSKLAVAIPCSEASETRKFKLFSWEKE